MSAENENAACVILPGHRVQHWDCTDYRNGVITSVVTGKIVGRS